MKGGCGALSTRHGTEGAASYLEARQSGRSEACKTIESRERKRHCPHGSTALHSLKTRCSLLTQIVLHVYMNNPARNCIVWLV